MKKYIILIPVYNDWKSVFKLLENIDEQIKDWDAEASVLIINDASTESKPVTKLSFKNIKLVRIMNMKKNQKSTRCIVTGLKYISENEKFDYIIPMDGDGEDRPRELNLLFNKSREYPDKVITAARAKRTEGPLFRFCYEIHKLITYVFAGHLIKFGNFTCLPKNSVIKMIEEPSAWCSFSGSLTKLNPDRISVPSIKDFRYYGLSKVNFFQLLIHSFSIIAVFKKTVFLRSFVFLAVYLSLVFNSLSLVTLFPVFLITIFLLSIAWLSKRVNLDQFHKSLDDISSIDNFN